MKNYRFAIGFTTLYLAVYTLLVFSGAQQALLHALFATSPVLVGWMVYTTLRHGAYRGRELRQDEEYGYEDV
jgi:predicted branched-subunit amino acid permease